MNMRIVFLRDESYQPVGCVAIHVEPGSAVLRYGFSVKNPQDRFDRKMGRQLAIGRMVEAPNTIKMHRNGGELTMHDITTEVMVDLVNHGRHVPTRAVKAARLWLEETQF